MSATRSPAPITVEQYENFKGYPGLRDELIFGEIVMSPQAKVLHQVVAKNIEHCLDRCCEGTSYFVLRDSNIKFPELNSMPAPDVFVTLRAAVREACERDDYLAIPPLLAVEVLSRANKASKIAQKIEIYLTAGVLSVWVVDPKRQTVRVHAPDRQETLHENTSGTIELPEPLRGAVSLEDIFRLDG